MNKKGFTIIETLLVVAMMSIAMLLVYQSYSYLISKEKSRIYYNDVVDIYRTQALKEYIIEYSMIEYYIDSFASSDTDRIFFAIGESTQISSVESLFYYPDEIGELLTFYDVYEMAILNPDFDVISQCSYSIANNGTTYNEVTEEEKYICQKSFINYSYEMITFIKSLGSNVEIEDNGYLLVVSYNIEGSDKKSYSYVSLGSDYGGEEDGD